MQEHVVRDVGRAQSCSSQAGRRRGAHALVGVDAEDPLAPRAGRGPGSGPRQVVDPLEVEDDAPVPPRDPPGRVGRSRVDHDDLIDEPGQGTQARAEVSRFVLDDQARGEEGPWSGWLDAGRGG